MCCTGRPLRILLLGPNRWPRQTSDPEAGLNIRRSMVRENIDLEVEWVLMEDDSSPGDPTKKFLSLATDPKTTHVFLVWPRDAKMVGTQDELVMWQAIKELKKHAPVCYLFHQAGVLSVNRRREEMEIFMDDPQGKSPYLYDLLAKGVFEQEWVDLDDLKWRIRQVLLADLRVATRSERSSGWDESV